MLASNTAVGVYYLVNQLIVVIVVFRCVPQSISSPCKAITILNFFVNRATNANAESFNAKVKAFRAQFRGGDRYSFLFI